MNVKIGEKIKALRKRDDMTQERLAEVLGVTNQAVSKWESGNSYPDIEYISPIANIFNVTIDYLFDHDTAEKQRKVQDYLTQYSERRLDNPSDCNEQIDIMRKALAEFPAEEILLLKLAETLYWKWSRGLWHKDRLWNKTIGHYTIPDVVMNKSLDHWEESMKIMEELLASSTDDNIRGQCRDCLAHIYNGIGEKEKFLALAEKCGSINSCKEHILSHSSWGGDGIRYKQEYLMAMFTPLQNTLRPLARRAGLNTENEAFTILLNLYELIFRDDCGFYNNWSTFLYERYAYSLIDNNKSDEALKALQQAFVYAKKYAEFANGTSEKTYTSPFTDLIKQPDIKNFNNPNSEVRWLSGRLKDNKYQVLHENAEFTALVKETEAWVGEKG
ncbi:MAG: helix-turn-helix domain-containing protein [Oscillospiraceae bacterium]|nr:helix-turn-helix domain-containing protein [Oscillospiraceae bacterium]